MNELSVELSTQVKKTRYLSIERKPSVDGVFYAGSETCLPNFSIDRQDFPFWTIEYIVEGRGSAVIGGKSHKLHAGSVICYGPGVPLHFHNDPKGPFHKYFLCRTNESFPNGWRQVGLAPGCVQEIAVSVPFSEVLDQLLHEGQQTVSKTPKILSALEVILLSYVHSNQQTDNARRTSSAKAYNIAMDILLRDFRELSSLTQFSERTGYGPEYLCRIFRRYHSESPYQALLRLKMYEAFRLLKEGQLRIVDIATSIGFDDPLHFSRVFRKTLGFPPSLVDKH